LRERDHLEDLGRGGRVILKGILNEYNWRVWTAWKLAGCCEHGNEPSSYNQYGEFFGKPRDWCVFKTDCVLWRIPGLTAITVFLLITNWNLWNFSLEIQEFCGIRTPALIVRMQAYTNKRTVLEYTVVTVKTLEFRNVSTLPYGSSSGSLHQYLLKA
jgi:hypothetical protein